MLRSFPAVLAMGMSLLSCGPAAPQSRPVALPGDIEVELALSALPAPLRDGATVYGYQPGRGYEVVIEGDNGFATLVGRDDPAIRFGTWEFDAYPEDLLIPIAFDAAGAATHLVTYLDLGRMRATGVAPAEAKRRLVEGFASGRYSAPERTGISYMLAPLLRAYRSTEVDATIGTFSTPHYMFYAPGVVNGDIGGGADLQHPFMLNRTPHPHGVIIQLAGADESRKIRETYGPLLDALCDLHDAWCLGGGS